MLLILVDANDTHSLEFGLELELLEDLDLNFALSVLSVGLFVLLQVLLRRGHNAVGVAILVIQSISLLPADVLKDLDVVGVANELFADVLGRLAGGHGALEVNLLAAAAEILIDMMDDVICEAGVFEAFPVRHVNRSVSHDLEAVLCQRPSLVKDDGLYHS
jgi:hypothetical protein